MSAWAERLAVLRGGVIPAQDPNAKSAESAKSPPAPPFGTIGTIGRGVFHPNHPSAVPPVPTRAMHAPVAPPQAANDPPPVPTDAAGPLAPCPRCGSGGWWRTSAFPTGRPGPWTCGTCHPPPAGTWLDGCAVPEGRA